MVSRWMQNGTLLKYLSRHQGPIDRLGLVSSDHDRIDGAYALRSLITTVFSYLESSVV